MGVDLLNVAGSFAAEFIAFDEKRAHEILERT